MHVILPRRLPAIFAPALALLVASSASGQAIGPDMISSSHNDVARNGVNAAGTITGYSIGAVTCNHGDMPALVQVANTVRPHMGQGMYRLKTFNSAAGGTYQRFEEIGQGWVKRIGLPVGGTGAGCGTCQPGAPVNYTGVNCGDTYSSAFNSPGGMAPRSRLNAATGEFIGAVGGGTGDANVTTRVQVATTDVTNQPAGTRFFVETVHLLPHDAQYLRPGQSIAVNALNNAASQEISINGGTSNPTLLNGLNQQIPAVERWKNLDPSVTLVTVDHDDTPNPASPGAFIRCRYYVAAKVTNVGANAWRYEYVVFNLNSDRSAGSFAVPLGAASAFTEYSFRHPLAHSGEVTSNDPWTSTRGATAITFATQKYVDNVNANAIRWGTSYNFGFTSDAAPATGPGLITLFKPGTIKALLVPGLPVPTVCAADINADHALTADDVIAYLDGFFNVNFTLADLVGLGGTAFPDGQLTADDLVAFLSSFFAGCP